MRRLLQRTPIEPTPAARRAWRRHAAACSVAALVALTAATSHAERSDREAPTQIEADSMVYDDLKQVNVFTGRVILNKGTIAIRADRLVLRQDPEGYQYGTAYGKPASFRQKREGLDETIEGFGQQIDYDGRNETVRLAGEARMNRIEGSRTVDQIEGGVIVYDSRSEQFKVDGAGPNASPGSGRVRVIIQPRSSGGDAAPPATAAPLKPAEQLKPRRGADAR